MNGESMREIVQRAVESAKRRGAVQVAVEGTVSREVAVNWRDGKIEVLSESTRRGLDLKLYVEGRYSVVSTSDLRPSAIDAFLANAVAMTRALAEDPQRALPDPELYAGQAKDDLKLEDPAYETVTIDARKRIAAEIEAAARAADPSGKVVTAAGSTWDGMTEIYRVQSNGFEGARRETEYSYSAEVTLQEADGRRPSEWSESGARHFSELLDPASIGREATARALSRLGAKKGATGTVTIVVEPRASGGLFRHLYGPLMARLLQQKRSMFEGKLGVAIGSPLLCVADDPLIVKGLGSRLFDAEGMAARRFPLFEEGVLRNYYVDSYYGRKLGMRPTTERPSNVSVKTGTRSCAEIVGALKDGIVITSFLGGNSNETTGDFSLGIVGARIRDGARAEPISEMNLSGNQFEFWKRLVEVGNDPYVSSALRTPALVIEGAQVAGT
jgi:PmbA protein